MAFIAKEFSNFTVKEKNKDFFKSQGRKGNFKTCFLETLLASVGICAGQRSKFYFFSAFEFIAALMQLKWRSLMNFKFPLNHFRFIALSQLNAVTAVLHFIQNRNCGCFDLNDVWLLRKEKSYNCLVLFVLV